MKMFGIKLRPFLCSQIVDIKAGFIRLGKIDASGYRLLSVAKALRPGFHTAVGIAFQCCCCSCCCCLSFKHPFWSIASYAHER